MAENARERAFDYDRTVALSDGVFSIALTLLVLTFTVPLVPLHDEHALAQKLADRLPELSSYAVSFAVLAALWMRHHAFYRQLARIDGTLTVLNLAYLAVVAFLPFPTRVLGRYGDVPVAPAVYAATIALIAGIALAKRRHAERAGLLAPGVELRPLGPSILVVAGFLASIPIGFIAGGRAATWTWAALLVFGLVRRRLVR